jgi:hypothetical protein
MSVSHWDVIARTSDGTNGVLTKTRLDRADTQTHKQRIGFDNRRADTRDVLKLSIRSMLESFTSRKERQRTFVNNGHHK